MTAYVNAYVNAYVVYLSHVFNEPFVALEVGGALEAPCVPPFVVQHTAMPHVLAWRLDVRDILNRRLSGKLKKVVKKYYKKRGKEMWLTLVSEHRALTVVTLVQHVVLW